MTKKHSRVAKSAEDVVLSQREAQRVVAEVAIRDAFEEMKDHYREVWEKTLPADHERREMAYRYLKVVADIWGALERKAHSARVRDLKAAQEKPDG